VRSSRGDHATAGAQRVRRGLMAVEVALAAVLLTGATLMMRTMHALASVDAGFDAANVSMLRLALSPGNRHTPEDIERSQAALAAFFVQARPRIKAVPGVADAAFGLSIPIEGSQWNSVFIVADQPVPSRADLPLTAMVPVTPGYFETLRIPLRAGRLLDD